VSVIEFEAWPKTPRLSSGGVTITEKIDGTNACVVIMPVDHPANTVESMNGVSLVEKTLNDHSVGLWVVGAQSRKRLIFPGQDNAGFAGWVQENAVDLFDLLGPGRHFGEWWGQGIQRRYNMDHKVFSLFNTHKWSKVAQQRTEWFERARDINMDLVPTLYQGKFSDQAIENALHVLWANGSFAAHQWGQAGQDAEGVIIRHQSLGGNLKAFVEDDDVPKSLQGSA
jgi:RNA ligase-like protein